MPPNNDEFRRLRNWFSYKLSQWKNDKLGAAIIEQLRRHNLDFSLYVNRNKGHGYSTLDTPMIKLMLEWMRDHDTYDLDAAAPKKLVEWQCKMIDLFAAVGPTIRHKRISNLLIGLSFLHWRTPTCPSLTAELTRWYSEAATFESGTQLYPSSQGYLHPKTPRDLVSWALRQKDSLRESVLSGRQRGWMIGAGLVADVSKKSSLFQELTKPSLQKRGEPINKYGLNDAHLHGLIVAYRAIRLMVKNSSDTEICNDIKVTPIVVAKMYRMLNQYMINWHSKSSKSNINSVISASRRICLTDTVQSSSNRKKISGYRWQYGKTKEFKKSVHALNRLVGVFSSILDGHCKHYV